MTTAYLFCYNLFNNLVKTRQIENIANPTQFVVNFRRLKLERVTLCISTSRSRIPSKSTPGSHQPKVSGWPGDKQNVNHKKQVKIWGNDSMQNWDVFSPGVWTQPSAFLGGQSPRSLQESLSPKKEKKLFVTFKDIKKYRLIFGLQVLPPWTRLQDYWQRRCPCP